ncbi:MAG: hypothetical protein K9M03_04370 [Kiritimatiellales bacterium]|nr:hypothetical protein [Kiritimatiellales bacterium]
MEDVQQQIIDEPTNLNRKEKECTKQERENIERTLAWIRGLIAQKLAHLSNGKAHNWRSWEAFSPIKNEQEQEELICMQMEIERMIFLLLPKASPTTLRQMFQRTLTIHTPPKESTAVGHIHALLKNNKSFATLRRKEQIG